MGFRERGRKSEVENGEGARAYDDSPIDDARRGSGAGFWQIRQTSLISEDEFLHGEFTFEKLDRDGLPAERNGANTESGGEETTKRANRELRAKVKRAVNGRVAEAGRG